MRRGALTNHGVLLAGLLSMFWLFPFLSELMLVRWLANLFLTVVFLGVVFATLNRPRLRWVVGVLVVPTVLLGWAKYFVSLPESLTVLSYVLQVLCFSVGALSILGDVVRAERVTPVKISGALSVYLLMGLVWAHLFAVLEVVSPGSFDLGTGAGSVPVPSDLFSEFFYYSFITLSTLGYGDITPVSDGARSLAALEAIAGQLYLTVLVARLVGLQISQSAPGSPDSS